MYTIAQSQTALPLLFYMTAASDHISPGTSAAPTVTISKNGAAFASPAGAVTEIANGWYAVAGNATDSNTNGPLLLHATGTGADPSDEQYFVGVVPVNVVQYLGTASQGAAGYAAVDMAQVVPTSPTAGTHGESLLMMLNKVGRRNTAQAGGASTITLDASASAVDNIYQTHGIKIISGTGAGQTATIVGYVGSTKVATITRPGGGTWSTNPDATSVFQIEANYISAVGFFLYTLLTETAGQLAAGFKQFFNVASPTSTMNTITAVTTTATASNLTTNNDKTGYGLSAAAVQAIWDALTSALTTAGSIGKRLVDFVTTLVYAAPPGAAPTAAAIRADLDANSTKLAFLTGDAYARIGASGIGLTNLGDTRIAHLDADVGTRSTYGGGDTSGVTTLLARAAPDNTSITAIKAKTDNLPASPAAVGSQMTIDMTQAVPTTNTAQSHGDCLNAARADGFGKWVLSGTTLTLYAADGTTPVHSFTLDSSTAPLSRT